MPSCHCDWHVHCFLVNHKELQIVSTLAENWTWGLKPTVYN